MKRYGFTLLLVLSLVGTSCAAALDVFVSIPPQKWVVDHVGGEHVSSHILIDAGQDPHTFEPSPMQIAQLTGAALYFTVGLPVEKQVQDILKDNSAPVQTVLQSEGIKRIPMSADHDHHAHDHDAEGLDPHVWLTPQNLMVMAERTATALSAADPQNNAAYMANLEAVKGMLEKLHAKLEQQLGPFSGASIFVFHPSFGYFTKNYNLEQEAVEVEGKAPTPKQLVRMISEARQDGVKVIFVQPQFDVKSATAVARAIDGKVVPLDPLAEDVYTNLELIGEVIAAALSGE